MRMRTKTRKMRIGSKLSLFFLLAILSAPAGEKKKALGPYALVGGTVFRDPGFALPDAQITLIPDPESTQTSAPADNALIKKMTALSDARGEFVFRVPVAPMRYTVRAAAKGYSPQEKSVSVEGEQRVDATFTLQPESK